MLFCRNDQIKFDSLYKSHLRAKTAAFYICTLVSTPLVEVVQLRDKEEIN